MTYPFYIMDASPLAWYIVINLCPFYSNKHFFTIKKNYSCAEYPVIVIISKDIRKKYDNSSGKLRNW